MSETNNVPSPASDVPKIPLPTTEISEAERQEIQRLDVLILTGHERPLRTESLKELKWLLYLMIALLITAVFSYIVLQAPERRVVALMASIAGGVISAWGGIRGVLAAKSGGIAGIGWIYAVFFSGLALVFGVMCSGLIGWLDGK